MAVIKRSVTFWGASTPVAKLERFFGLSSVSDGLAIKSEVKGSISLITSSSSQLIRLLEQSL